MRSFSDKEKIILNLFDVSNGVKFQNLFSGVIDDNKMIIDYKAETIKVKDLNKMCMISGDSGFNVYQRTIIPNKFIGFWVTNDNLDTMVISTNNSFERPHNYYYDLYSYSYSSDSFRIQYKGPDKIGVLPISNRYIFWGDTLMINYSSNYHPSIKKGLKKYLKINNASR